MRWIILLVVTIAGCQTIDVLPRADPVFYKINRGDTLRVEVYNEPDLSRGYKVEEDGTILMPLLGRVAVSGFSMAEVRLMITRALEAEYLVDPKVSASVVRSMNRPVMVFGQVRQPGSFDILPDSGLTLLQVIARAGGFTDIAACDRVLIVRVENGKERKVKVRTSDLMKGRNGKTDVTLMPGDVITVPETLF